MREMYAIIAQLRPAAVVSFYEWTALPAARMARSPSVLVTDWFPSRDKVIVECVPMADSIIFLGQPGIFPLPFPVTRDPIFVGPIVRKMRYDRRDRHRVRIGLGISKSTWLVSVIPGAWATEERSPVADKILTMFRQLDFTEKNLFWLTKSGYQFLSQKTASEPDIRIIQNCSNVEQVIAASDVVITKGNHGSIMESASLGVSSIFPSDGHDYIDDILVPPIRSNKYFIAAEAEPTILCNYMEGLAAMPFEQRAEPLLLHLQGGTVAAKALAAELELLTCESKQFQAISF
jgi:hypothetical protein